MADDIACEHEANADIIVDDIVKKEISSTEVDSLDNVDGENAEEVGDEDEEEELLRPLLLVDVQDGGGLVVLLQPGHRVVVIVTPQAVRVTRPEQKYLEVGKKYL